MRNVATTVTIAKQTAMRKPQKKGMFHAVSSHQQVQAPMSRNSPWAKFTTCEAL